MTKTLATLATKAVLAPNNAYVTAAADRPAIAGSLGAMDPQVVLDLLVAMDDNALHFILGELLQSKPNLAPDLISSAVPDLTYAPSKAVTEKRCTGVLQSVRAEGMSFILCPQLQAAFGCDVCVAPAQVAGFVQGEQVSFAVTVNEKSEPQAIDLQSLSSKDAGNPARKRNKVPPASTVSNKRLFSMSTGLPVATEQLERPPDLMSKLPSQSMPLQSLPAKGVAAIAAISAAAANNPKAAVHQAFPKQAMTGVTRVMQSDGWQVAKSETDPAEVREILGEYYGVIRNFDPFKGFGFIFCKELYDAFNVDVYVHGDSCAEFGTGAEVKFEAYMYNGKVQGRNLEDATGKVQASAPAPPNEIGTFVGEVKVFHWDRGYGFIGCDALRAKGYNCDPFVHHTEIKDFWPGQLVAFKAYENAGKLLARDLKERGRKSTKIITHSTECLRSREKDSERPSRKPLKITRSKQHFVYYQIVIPRNLSNCPRFQGISLFNHNWTLVTLDLFWRVLDWF